MKWGLILLYSVTILAMTDSINRFCFPTNQQMSKAESELQSFLLKNEKVLSYNNQCFDLVTTSERIEFLNSFISMRFSGVNQDSLTKSVKQCRLKLTKVGNENNVKKNIKIQNPFMAKQQDQKNELHETSSLVLSSGKQAQLTYDQQTLHFFCRHINSKQYEIDFSISYEQINQKYVHQGQIVEVQQPKPDNSIEVKTSLILNRGEKIEIGDINRQLNKKAKNLNTKGIELGKTQGHTNYKLYLSID